MSHRERDLTRYNPTGTMKEGGEPEASRLKSKRPKGPYANLSKDTLLRLHTYFRDYACFLKSEECELSAYEALAMICFELAELLKEEYDKRHG